MDVQLAPREKTKLKRWKTLLAIAATVIASIVATIWILQRPSATMAPLQVEAGPLADSVPINATLVSSRSAIVSTTTGGNVVEISAYPGQAVHAGQDLLRLSNSDLERQYSEAASALAGARADLVSAKVDGSELVASKHMERAKAEGHLKVADLQLDAERKLQQQGIISLIALSRTQAERDGLVIEVKYAREQESQALPSSRAKVEAAEERVAALRSRADSLKAQLEGLTSKAPFDGVVSKVDAKLGAFLTLGAQVAEVVTPKMELNFEVSEQYVSAIHVGQSLRLDKGLEGTVISISPTADGGIIHGRASVRGDMKGLRSNSVLTGEAIVSEHGTGLFVTAPSLDFANKVVAASIQSREGHIERRDLTFGPRYGQRIQIIRGASEGDSIVGLP